MTQVRKTKFLPPLVVLISMSAMFLLDKYFPIISWQHTKHIGTLILLLSFLLILYCAYLFNKHNTAIKPFDESTFLILSWPYTLSRNPIYLSMLLFLFGWVIFLESISAVFILPIFIVWIHFRFVLQEAVMLTNQFGEDYIAYKNSVRRWL